MTHSRSHPSHVKTAHVAYQSRSSLGSSLQSISTPSELPSLCLCSHYLCCTFFATLSVLPFLYSIICAILSVLHYMCCTFYYLTRCAILSRLPLFFLLFLYYTINCVFLCSIILYVLPVLYDPCSTIYSVLPMLSYLCYLCALLVVL